MTKSIILCLLIIIGTQTTANGYSLTYKEDLVSYSYKEAIRRKSVRDIIRAIRNKPKKPKQDMRRYYIPLEEYYLDPPVLPHSDLDRLASSLVH